MPERAMHRRSGSGWMLTSLGLIVLSWVAFALLATFSEIRPGNVWGMTFGIAAALLLVLSGAYGIRRRAQRVASRWKLGSASSWLALHVWGSLLFLVCVLLHSGLSLPKGLLTWSLWLLSLWTVLTGLVGLGLQRWLPKALATLSTEALYERIPELCEKLRARALEIVEASSEPLPRLFERRLERVFAGPRYRFRFFLDVTGGIGSRLEELDYVRRFLEPAEKEKLDELRALYRTKVELDAHYTLQRALRVWLTFHLPFSMLLAILVAVHVLVVLTY